MDQIPTLHQRYSGKPLHHCMALRSIRPHPGIWLGGGSHRDMAGYETRGMDILLVLLRQLMSFGYGINSQEKPRYIEEEIIKAANLDFGWEQEVDWKIKRHLFDTHNGETSLRIPSQTLQQLLQSTSLSNLFVKNIQFRLMSTTPFQRTSPVDTHPVFVNPRSSQFLQKNRLSFDSSRPLSQQISEHFNPISGQQYTSLRPKFLMVEYKVVGRGCPISELRVLSFRAPEARQTNTGWQKGIQQAIYHLCAVVRITDRKQERIRIYSKEGPEMIPAEVGLFREKEPEAVEAQWSIEDVGVYLLLYFRLHRPDDQFPASEMDIDAPEFGKRGWVER